MFKCTCRNVSVQVQVWKCQCVSVSVEVSVFKGFSGRTLRNAFGKKNWQQRTQRARFDGMPAVDPGEILTRTPQHQKFVGPRLLFHRSFGCPPKIAVPTVTSPQDCSEEGLARDCRSEGRLEIHILLCLFIDENICIFHVNTTLFTVCGI